nr:MAG TPA: hypothetical protein [Caudoviricetes sp.]
MLVAVTSEDSPPPSRKTIKYCHNYSLSFIYFFALFVTLI